MSLFSRILLLAACSTSIIAGPVPRGDRRQLFTSYANTTSAISSTEVVQASVSNVYSSTTSIIDEVSSNSLPLSASVSALNIPASSSATQQANANTALVIEPIQSTVITHVISAVTFLNLKGEAIATQEAETVLSTSYFTPTPMPALQPSTPVSSIIVPLSSQTLRSSTHSLQSSRGPFPGTSASVVPVSSRAAVESGQVNGTNIPAFTYAPEESGSSKPIVSPTPVVTSKPVTGNSTGMPGFNHPGFASQSLHITSIPVSLPAAGTVISKSAVQASSSAGPVSSSQRVPAASLSAPSSTNSTRPTTVPGVTNSISSTRVFITKTEYTTVFPSPSTVAVSPMSTQKLSSPPPQGADLGGVSTNSVAMTSSKSSIVALAPSPIAPPPVIIVTQYTTVTPSPTQVPSPAPVLSAPTSPVVLPPSSAPSSPPSPILPTPAPALSSQAPGTIVNPSSAAAQPTPPSRAPESPAKPSSPVAPSPPPQASPSTTPATPAPSSAPPVAPSSTSDGPLAIIPIAPSQIFTVTVTATATAKETITKTETATVSVTVRA